MWYRYSVIAEKEASDGFMDELWEDYYDIDEAKDRARELRDGSEWEGVMLLRWEGDDILSDKLDF